MESIGRDVRLPVSLPLPTPMAAPLPAAMAGLLPIQESFYKDATVSIPLSLSDKAIAIVAGRSFGSYVADQYKYLDRINLIFLLPPRLHLVYPRILVPTVSVGMHHPGGFASLNISSKYTCNGLQL